MHTIRTLASGTLAAALLVTTAATAGAITYGDVDDENLFPSVGGLVAEIERGDVGTIYRVICTGTLIDDTTFLTAAHCLTPGLRETDTLLRFGVTFEVDVAPIEAEGAEQDLSSITWGEAAYVSPEWGQPVAGDGGDVGVLELTAAPAGIPTSDVAPVGWLDELGTRALRAAEFETAGYGTIREEHQGGNWAILDNLERRWVTQTYLSRSGSILKLSMNPATSQGGTCYGDSGGPHFLDGLIVSITSTGDAPCKALDTTYRVDTAAVAAFLEDPATVGVLVWPTE